MRTPIMIRWPGTVQPTRIDTLVSSIDIAPTILTACGVHPPDAMSGINLLDLCAGRPVSREAVFGELYSHDIADIRDPSKSLMYRWCVSGQWKLIRHYPGKTARYTAVLKPHEPYPQLYDLSADPEERRNLAGAYPKVVAAMTRMLEADWQPFSPPIPPPSVPPRGR